MSAFRGFSKGLLAVLALQGLTACVSLHDEDPPVCDGRHRRPANPYGLVLATSTPTEAPVQTPEAGAAVESNKGVGGCA